MVNVHKWKAPGRPLCRWCGRNLRKHTITYFVVDDPSKHVSDVIFRYVQGPVKNHEAAQRLVVDGSVTQVRYERPNCAHSAFGTARAISPSAGFSAPPHARWTSARKRRWSRIASPVLDTNKRPSDGDCTMVTRAQLDAEAAFTQQLIQEAKRMNLARLYAIIDETTIQYRKGAAVIHRQEGRVAVTEVFAMPHIDEALARDDLVKVDVEFMVIAVDKAKAEQRKDELLAILKTYPQPDRLAAGPSYIEMGGVLGDQGVALRLFALGQVLGLWSVLTTFGIEGEDARKMAGQGLVMMTGHRT
jgi:hypothetical protein